ncbi:hypothetical protein RB653_006543 [Dictyostelium firmibasis]|uniref:DOCK family protein n=1 Tax=Dictyostelium firmibasis TaxID=79012 RepID=A0AAN7TTQ5_9MYCE
MADQQVPKPVGSISKLQGMFNKPAAETAPPKIVPNFKIVKKSAATPPTSSTTSSSAEGANKPQETTQTTPPPPTTASAASSSSASSTPSTSPVITGTPAPKPSGFKTSPILKPVGSSIENTTTTSTTPSSLGLQQASISQPTTPGLKPANRVFVKQPAGSTSAPTTPSFKGATPIRKSPSSNENLAAVAAGTSSTTTTVSNPIRKSPSTSENLSTPTTTPPTISPTNPQLLVYVLPPIAPKDELSETSSSTTTRPKTTVITNKQTASTPTITKPATITNEINEILSNEISKKSSKKIKEDMKSKEYVRVLSNRKGDFSSLSVVRGDVLEIKEKGEKDTYLGCNGYKTASFSLSNTKNLYPKENEPPFDSQKVVAIKDIRTNNNYTVIRGDVLCILETKQSGNTTTYLGRVKVGLDGWGEKLEFPSDSVRNISEREYILFGNLLDVVIEVSEQLMDPELFANQSSPRSNSTTSSLKISEKQIEKNQLVLRDRVKSLQTVREQLLNSGTPNPELEVTLFKEIEITRAFLSNEFYIINDNGNILTSENESPMKLLKYHYQMNEKKNTKESTNPSSSSSSSSSPSSSSSSLSLSSSGSFLQLGSSSQSNTSSKSFLQLATSQPNNSSSSSLLNLNDRGIDNSNGNGIKKQWEYGQIICDIKFNKCSLPPKKNFEFYFSLYNFSQSRYITEQVQVEWDSVLPSTSAPSTSSIVSFKCIFKNIEPSDITEDICFLCKVVRKGPFKDLDESTLKKGTNIDFRRPYAFGCISIPNLVVENQTALERQGVFQFYSTSSTDLSISQIPDFLMKNSDEEIRKHLEMVPKVTSGLPQSILPVSLSFYDIGFDVFSNKFPQFQKIVKVEKLEHKIVFAEKIHKFYLTLDSGKFSQGKKMEVIIRVRLDDGEYLQNCMSLGDSANGTFVSEIRSSTCPLNSNGTTTWNESIHFNISEVHFPRAHVLFFVKNRSNSSSKEKNSLVGFSFLKLGNDNSTVISNGDHSISLYKLNSMDNLPIQSYIDLNSQIGGNIEGGDSSPSSSSKSGLNLNKSALLSKESSSSSSPSSKESSSLKKGESLKVKTLLHSSDFIQHSSVIQLIDWKNHKNILSNLLDRFKFVDTIQIMRNLNKILDSLLSIFDMYSNEGRISGKPDPNTLSVYNTIVFVMGLLTDERTNRFKHFKSEMDRYIIEQFSFATTHKHLLRCISYSIEDISTKETAKISNTLKALDYMFQLITKSRLVYIREQQAKQLVDEETQWKQDLRDFLALLNNLMSNSNEKLLIVPQTFALRNFDVIMKGLSNFFNTTELCVILSDFMESVYYSDKNFYQSKLTIYHKILSTQLPIGPSTYQHLLPALVSTIDQHLNKGEELRLSNQLLALLLETIELLDTTDRNKAVSIIAIVFTKMFTLVDSLLTTISNDTTFTSMTIEHTYLLSNFYTIIHYFIKCGTPITSNGQPSKYSNHFEKYIQENLTEEKTIKPFIKKLLRIMEGFIGRSIYSSKWPTLNLFQYNVTLSVLETLEPYCCKYFTTQSDLDGWTLLFNVKFAFLTSSSLRLNENRIHRLGHIKQQLDEIRSYILISIIKSWNHLLTIQLQNQFNQSLLVNLLYALLNGNNDVNEFIQNLFYIIMKNEFLEYKSLKRIESKTIEVLDKITIRERICDEDIFKNFLIKRLTDSVVESSGSGDLILTKESKSFISNINQLLSLLFEFRTLPTDRAFEEERTIATLKMMEYFKDRKDTYIKYLYELLNQHLANGYYTEAGFAILLHSDLYEWNSEQILPPYTLALNQQPTTMPQESSSDRKVRLLKMAIQYLDKGQVWERCVTLLQDLKLHYEQTYNFKGLSEVSFQEAEFYEKILNTERLFAEYFRVGYYGKKFPLSIQGKEFLYKGFELERLSDFTARILAKFPDAELLKSTSEPTTEIQNSDGKYLLITIVNPSNLDEVEKKQKPIIPGTPNNSKSYLKRNDVNVFVYSKPFEKASGAVVSNSNNKFGDLWIKNHFLLTDSSFPTIHRRAEVIKKLHVDLSPIENAINSVSSKNEELDEMVKKYEKSPQLNLNPLAMALNGSIDAAVNGGISLYKEAFYQVPEPYRPKKPFLVKLSSELTSQANILGSGLIIHSKRCPDELRGLHEKLESFFPKLKSEIQSIHNLIE